MKILYKYYLYLIFGSCGLNLKNDMLILKSNSSISKTPKTILKNKETIKKNWRGN